jgi:hypothetical protein
MLSYNLGKGIHEIRPVVESRHPLVASNSRLFGHVAVFLVQLGQRLDVITGEGDRHHEHILVALLPQLPNDHLRPGTEPADGAYIRLVGQDVRIGSVQLFHDPLHTGPHFLGVRVAAIDHLEWQRVGAEEDEHLVASVGGESPEALAHRAGHR